MKSNKVLLIILDGYGKGKAYKGNAISQASTPTLDHLEATAPSTLLKTDSEAVGLPAGTMGGSEVGHYTIGAGRIVLQSLPAINHTIADGSFFENPELLGACEYAKQNQSSLHLVGMISDAGVHSHINHLFSLLELAKRQKISKVFIHAITDGRDVPERSANKYLEQIQTKIDELGIGQITDLIGRFYAMDRDENWERTKAAYDLYTKPSTEVTDSAKTAVTEYYKISEESDYYLNAKKIAPNEEGLIKSKDSVIFFNYRTDRAKQLTDAFTLKEFTHFKQNLSSLPYMVCFGEYTKVAPVAFKPVKIEANLGRIVSNLNLKQLRIAETEKYPHVTFFFNSQNKEPYPGEDRIMVPSPKVASYAEKPAMSAAGVTDKLINALDKQEHNLIVVNYANLDLVGHSGEIDATIKACEVVDKCLEQVLASAKENNYNVVITGDHGNAEEMLYEDGDTCPSHSMNPTQCFVIKPESETYKLKEKNNGLQDITPTILELMGIKKPETMTGENLIVNS